MCSQELLQVCGRTSFIQLALIYLGRSLCLRGVSIFSCSCVYAMPDHRYCDTCMTALAAAVTSISFGLNLTYSAEQEKFLPTPKSLLYPPIKRKTSQKHKKVIKSTCSFALHTARSNHEPWNSNSDSHITMKWYVYRYCNPEMIVIDLHVGSYSRHGVVFPCALQHASKYHSVGGSRQR